MKQKILRLSLLPLLFITIIACQKEDDEPDDGNFEKSNEIEYSDENIVVNNYPTIAVYKTKNDYFDYVSLRELPDGKLKSIPYYLRGRDLPEGIRRWRLKSGHVVDGEPHFANCVFTDITFFEFKHSTWSEELIESRIVDKDPYVEFYESTSSCNCDQDSDYVAPPIEERVGIKYFTLGEISSMLEDGTIDEHFTKLK